MKMEFYFCTVFFTLFSNLSRSSITILWHFKHFILMSAPVLKTSHVLPPQGCCFFVSTISPVSNCVCMIHHPSCLSCLIITTICWYGLVRSFLSNVSLIFFRSSRSTPHCLFGNVRAIRRIVTSDG